MMKKIKLVSTAILAVFAVFIVVPARAINVDYEYPSILWGTTSVIDSKNTQNTDDDNIFYAQTEGNVAVRNVAAGALDNLIFGVNCMVAGVEKPCFSYLNEENLKILNARTYVNGFMKNTLAVIAPVGINVFGDSFSASGNFNYWGRHLRQTEDRSGSNSYWQIINYIFNSDAQAYWDPTAPDKNATMNATIERLKANSKPTDSIFGTDNWSQYPFFGICGRTPFCSESNQYPEGRVWLKSSGGATIYDNSLQYYSRATIIIEQGDLAISTNVVKNNDQSSLGFIVRSVRNGNVSITNRTGGTMKVEANIFAPNGTIAISGNNIDLIGTFVAKDFTASGNNINIIQDTRGETAFPPGFRELQIPSLLAK